LSIVSVVCCEVGVSVMS